MIIPAELKDVGDLFGFPYSWERSIKVSPGSISAERSMMRLPCVYGRRLISKLARDFGLPPVVFPEFDFWLARSDSVYLGVDGGTSRRVYASPMSNEPGGEGFVAWKWNLQNGQWFVTRYPHWPHLGLDTVLGRVRSVLDGRTWLTVVSEAFVKAIYASGTDYFEGNEDDSPRRSFYVNARDPSVPFGVHRPFLDMVASHFDVTNEAGPVWDDTASGSLGFFAGGVGRTGEDYLSFYVGATVVGAVPERLAFGGESVVLRDAVRQEGKRYD